MVTEGQLQKKNTKKTEACLIDLIFMEVISSAHKVSLQGLFLPNC